jgi:hypothetical protein
VGEGDTTADESIHRQSSALPLEPLAPSRERLGTRPSEFHDWLLVLCPHTRPTECHRRKWRVDVHDRYKRQPSDGLVRQLVCHTNVTHDAFERRRRARVRRTSSGRGVRRLRINAHSLSDISQSQTDIRTLRLCSGCKHARRGGTQVAPTAVATILHLGGTMCSFAGLRVSRQRDQRRGRSKSGPFDRRRTRGRTTSGVRARTAGATELNVTTNVSVSSRALNSSRR